MSLLHFSEEKFMWREKGIICILWSPAYKERSIHQGLRGHFYALITFYRFLKLLPGGGTSIAMLSYIQKWLPAD